MQEYLAALAEQIVASVPNILTALLIFVLSLYLARVLSNLLKRVLLRRNIASGVVFLLSEILLWTIIVFGAITALQRFFNVTAFITGLGILGFTVGFALQNVMQNFVSGIILLMQEPFRVGDDISVSGFDGTVLTINLRTTEMQTLDGRIVILPNAEVLAHAIVNYTRAHRRRVDLPLAVAYGSSPEQVRAIIFEIVKDVHGYVAAPASEVVFNHFGNSSIEFTVSFWVDTSVTKIGLARDSALINIKDAFDRQNIQIPLPAQTVYLKSEE